MAGDEGRADAASEGAAHDEEVVAAEAAGFDLDEGVEFAYGRWGQVLDGEVGDLGSFLEDEGFQCLVTAGVFEGWEWFGVERNASGR